MGEKGTAAVINDVVNQLPPGYRIVKGVDQGFHAEPAGPRPGLPLSWNDAHNGWNPPGFNPDPTDPNRIFNKLSGQNGVWDDKANQWIDSQTGRPLSYEQ
jgi:hypothetical protein